MVTGNEPTSQNSRAGRFIIKGKRLEIQLRAAAFLFEREECGFCGVIINPLAPSGHY
jgi:hypothetical protein